jgi:HAD superfamily hydrolase (TIGR01509 family)
MERARKIEAVLFDMDGVLTDSEPLICAAAIAMFQELGLEVVPEDFRPFVGMGESRYLGGVAEAYGILLDIPGAKKRTYDIYLARVEAELRIFPGAADKVNECRAAGFRIAVASSADTVKVTANLNKLGIPIRDWDAVVTAEDAENKKPAPDIFLAAARKLGVAPEHCVVIEDAIHGLQAAKAAGMRCVALAQSFSADSLQEADLVRDRIADLTLADLDPQWRETTAAQTRVFEK